MEEIYSIVQHLGKEGKYKRNCSRIWEEDEHWSKKIRKVRLSKRTRL